MNDELLDLEKLAPTNPAAAAPGWPAARQRIHDEVLSDGTATRTFAPWQLMLGVAAAVLLVVAMTGIVQQLGQTPVAIPAETPSASPPLLKGSVLLTGSGDDMELCWGRAPLSELWLGSPSSPPHRPMFVPECLGQKIRVTALTWDDVPWATSIEGVNWATAELTGNFSGSGFVATQVRQLSDPKATKLPVFPQAPNSPESMCSTPARGTGSGDANDVLIATKSMAGFQGSWSTVEPRVLNVAFTPKQVEAGRKITLATFNGAVCVGTIPGPTQAALEKARVAAENATGVQATHLSPSPTGNYLEVLVLTGESEANVAAAVGAAWQFTRVTAIFTPITPVTPSGTSLPRGEAARWVLLNPAEVSKKSTSVRVAVTRIDCNSGRTGEVLPPEVSISDDQITIRTDVVGTSGGLCPGNDSTEVAIQLPEPIGDRQLVDAYCLSKSALESICQLGAVRWSP